MARTQNNDFKELDQQLKKYAPDTMWKFSKVRLQKQEKAAYINTSVRVAIDLRATQVTMLLQSTSFPCAPDPATTIADILQLRGQQRFDLLAIPMQVLGKRVTGGAHVVADVRLADGSETTKNGERAFATTPLTLFFKNETEFESFEKHIGKKPVLFMCLNGNLDNGEVKVTTVKT